MKDEIVKNRTIKNDPKKINSNKMNEDQIWKIKKDERIVK